MVDFQTAYKMTSQASVLAEHKDRKNSDLYYSTLPQQLLKLKKIDDRLAQLEHLYIIEASVTRGQNFQTSTAVYYRARPVFEEARK